MLVQLPPVCPHLGIEAYTYTSEDGERAHPIQATHAIIPAYSSFRRLPIFFLQVPSFSGPRSIRSGMALGRHTRDLRLTGLGLGLHWQSWSTCSDGRLLVHFYPATLERVPPCIHHHSRVNPNFRNVSRGMDVACITACFK